MVPFNELTDEQRYDLAYAHPEDVNSLPSSPSAHEHEHDNDPRADSSGDTPDYLRPRRRRPSNAHSNAQQSQATAASHAHSKSTSRHRSRTTSDVSTSILLARLITRDDDIRRTQSLLANTTSRLETECNRANTAERRALELLGRLKSVLEARERADLDVARLTQELKLYKDQLEMAQKEIFRAQDIINEVSAQKTDAEEDAARARSKARKLQEEKMVMMAREEGRRQGYKEGLSVGRRIAYDEARSSFYGSSRGGRQPHRPVVEEEDDDDEGDNDVQNEREEREQDPAEVFGRRNSRATRSSGADTRTSTRVEPERPDSTPPAPTFDTAPIAPAPPVPTLVTPPPILSPSHVPSDELLESIANSNSNNSLNNGSGPETIRPLPMRPTPNIPRRSPSPSAVDTWIPEADARTSYIHMPSPHELSGTIPGPPSQQQQQQREDRSQSVPISIAASPPEQRHIPEPDETGYPSSLPSYMSRTSRDRERERERDSRERKHRSHDTYPSMRSREYAHRPMTVPPPGAEGRQGMPMSMPAPMTMHAPQHQYQQQQRQQVPQRAPTLPSDVLSPTSTHISQYDLVSAPGTGSQGRRPSMTIRSDWGPDRSHTASVMDSLVSSRGKTSRSDREREKEREKESDRTRSSRQTNLVESWRTDPDVVSTTTPASIYQRPLAPYSSEPPRGPEVQYTSQPQQAQEQRYPPAPRTQGTPYQQPTYAPAATSHRQTVPVPPYPSGPPRPRQLIMPGPLANQTMGADNVPTSSRPPLPPLETPSKKRSPLDYFRKKRPRMQSSSSVPNIIVESPSESASSQTGETKQPELLTPDSAHEHAPLPAVERLETEPAQTRDPSPNPSPLSLPAFPMGFAQLDQRQPPQSHAQPYLPPRAQTQTQPPPQTQDQSQLMRPPTRSGSRASSRQQHHHTRGGPYAYESAPMPAGVVYPEPPNRQMQMRKEGGRGDRGGLAAVPPRHPTQNTSPAPLNRPISLFND